MPHIDHEALRKLVAGIVAASGSSEREAELVAGQLVASNLVGHDSHGVGLLPFYVEHLKVGLLKVNQHAELIKDKGGILIVDGHNGYGQVVAREATEFAIDRARKTGLALMTLRNSHHIGRVGEWAEMCADAGLVSMHFVNVIGMISLVAPYRGSDARFGTNPVCIAFPATANRPRIVLDMATSRIAMGKVTVAFNKGEQLAPGMVIDGDGQPTTDPAEMIAKRLGALLPFGEHKGYGLAVMCELLAGVLSGGGTISTSGHEGGIFNTMLTVVIDPQELVDLDHMHREMEDVLNHIQASPAANPNEPVLIPGDPERAAREERLAHGIPLDETTWGNLTKIAAKLDVRVPAID